jgi:hypothetical protein
VHRTKDTKEFFALRSFHLGDRRIEFVESRLKNGQGIILLVMLLLILFSANLTREQISRRHLKASF